MKSGNDNQGFAVELTEAEKAKLDEYAHRHGMTTEEAASHLVSTKLQALLRRKTGRSPARNVLHFRKR